jgi:eukaryotic-like serine/threonine-protein kinase
MGEVYRARDSGLDREVAIKVLPSHLNQNPNLRARFEREARAISGLQQSNICVLYDVGPQGEVDFLVMEYLEAKLSRPASRKGPVNEALNIAIAIVGVARRASSVNWRLDWFSR